MGNLIAPPTHKIAHACRRAAARAGGPAIGRELPYALLQVDGHQVGHGQGPEQFLVGHAQLLRIDNHWQRGGQPLVPAARVDDHRQLAAAHSAVRASSGHGLCPVLHLVSVGVQQDFSNARAPFPAEPLLGHGHVQRNLPVQGGGNALQLYLTGKAHNILHVQLAALVLLKYVLAVLPAQQDIFPPLHTNHVGMRPGNLHKGPLFPGPGGNLYVQQPAPL